MGQTMAELFTTPARATDANGENLSGAKWFFYQTGTLTPQSVFTTAALSTAHLNPVVADAAGKFPAIFFDTTKQYRGILRTADEATVIYDLDPINAGVMSILGAPSGSSEIGFLQAGTGAVPRHVEDKLRESINPKDFGAALDGATDDTAAMARSIVQAIARPGSIIDLDGRTAYCGALTLPNCRGLTIRNGYIKVRGDVTWLSGAPSATSITFIKIENIFFDASEHVATGRALIDWSKFTYSEFCRLWIYNVNGGRTIGLYAAGDGVVGPYYNIFENIYGGGLFAGIQMATAATVVETVNNNTIRNCRFNPGASNRYGVFIGTNNQQNRILDSVMEDTIGGIGIYNNGIGTIIRDTRFEGMTVGIDVGPDATGHESGCYFDSNSLERQFATTAARLRHNIIGGVSGVGVAYENILAGGLRAGGGLRLRGDPGFPGDLLTGEAHAYASPALGGVYGGYGSTNDLTFLNRSGLTAARVPTNTQEWVFEGPARLRSYTVAGLPPATTVGRQAFVTDANATTYASVVAGGGSNGVPVYSDGTNWRIG